MFLRRSHDQAIPPTADTPLNPFQPIIYCQILAGQVSMLFGMGHASLVAFLCGLEYLNTLRYSRNTDIPSPGLFQTDSYKECLVKEH